MDSLDENVNVVLIADRPSRAKMLRDLMQQAGVSGVIRRLAPGEPAIDCARQSGSYHEKPLPDLIIYDYAHPDKHCTLILKNIAFGAGRSSVPVILLTSPESQTLLESGEIDGGNAVMFSPTGLAAFIGKMESKRRQMFFKALHTLYQFGPILVRTPSVVLRQDRREMAVSA